LAKVFGARAVEPGAWLRQNCRAWRRELNVIELTDVTCGYGDRPLLSGVSLALQPGSFHFLTGPSGAGKTTLLRLCYADLLPSGGAVTVLGHETSSATRDELAAMRRRIGVVHQDCQFLDHLPLDANIALPLLVAGIDPGTKAGDIRELIDWVGLTDQLSALPPSLSGGERQRAALARAVISSPDVLIADEPTGNLDWEMSLRLLRLLAELNRLGTAILVATHDLNHIRAAKTEVQARVLRIRGGTIEAAGADL
jgi:cell division transport system ATP-binding protein